MIEQQDRDVAITVLPFGTLSDEAGTLVLDSIGSAWKLLAC
jgi:hypothetical protein